MPFLDVGIFPTYHADMHITPSHQAGSRLASSARAGQSGEGLSLRQLRHHVGNTWQRLLCELAVASAAAESEEARLLARDIEQRMSAAIAAADLLFGFTEAPGPFEARLEKLCRQILTTQASSAQRIALEVRVNAVCPPAMATAVLRVAREMMSNALKHGLHARARGTIQVEFATIASQGHVLRVIDDGWGPGGRMVAGEGSAVMRGIAQDLGGSVSLRRVGQQSIAMLAIPFAKGAA